MVAGCTEATPPITLPPQQQQTTTNNNNQQQPTTTNNNQQQPTTTTNNHNHNHNHHNNNNRASGRHSGQHEQPLGHHRCARPYNIPGYMSENESLTCVRISVRKHAGDICQNTFQHMCQTVYQHGLFPVGIARRMAICYSGIFC